MDSLDDVRKQRKEYAPLDDDEDSTLILPAWAQPEKYEYDLGMATCCIYCNEPLEEGQYVYVERWTLEYDEKTMHCSDYYCSVKCVLAAVNRQDAESNETSQ
jgi:hypothetical protein